MLFLFKYAREHYLCLIKLTQFPFKQPVDGAACNLVQQGPASPQLY